MSCMRPLVRRGWPLLAIIAVALAACRGSSQSASPRSTTAGTATATATATTTGVSSNEILIGSSFALSGPAASFAVITKAEQAYFDWVNAQGGVYGRKIKFIVRDDQYNPAQTVSVVHRLVTEDGVFAVFSSLGTPTGQAVLGYLNEQKVPFVFVASAASLFNNPRAYPLTFGFAPTYAWEGAFEARYYLDHLAGKKVGILYQNDDFGKEYLDSFLKAVGSGAPIVSQQGYEATATDVGSQIAALRQAGAQVVIIYALPSFAAKALKDIHNSGWQPTILMASVSADPLVIGAVGPAASNGVITMGYMPLASDGANESVQFLGEILAKYAAGTPVTNWTLDGLARAELLVHALKRAGPDLTRARFIDALQSIKDYKFAPLAPATITSNDHTALHCLQPMRVENGQFSYFGAQYCQSPAP